MKKGRDKNIKKDYSEEKKILLSREYHWSRHPLFVAVLSSIISSGFLALVILFVGNNLQQKNWKKQTSMLNQLQQANWDKNDLVTRERDIQKHKYEESLKVIDDIFSIFVSQNQCLWNLVNAMNEFETSKKKKDKEVSMELLRETIKCRDKIQENAIIIKSIEVRVNLFFSVKEKIPILDRIDEYQDKTHKLVLKISNLDDIIFDLEKFNNEMNEISKVTSDIINATENAMIASNY